MAITDYTATDAFIYDQEIRPYLPKRLFDAHTHLQLPEHHPDLETELPITKNPAYRRIDLPALRAWWQMLFPGARVGGLLLGMPTETCDIQEINRYLGALPRQDDIRFSILTSPTISAEELERQIVTYRPHGLKPYMCFAQIPVHNHARITDMIPEAHIALGDKYGLAVTLHVAKPRGMADPDNLRDMNRLVKAYPRCQFILAHCGRCFITPNMEATLVALTPADNLWFDTSAVCDIGVFLNLLTQYDRKRILFGTDLVTATGFRGTYMRMGMSWDWYAENLLQRPGGMEIKATFATYENLCALCHALKFCKFSEAEREDLFFNNAARLFQLTY